MRWLDWSVVIVYLVWVVSSGIRASRRTNELDGYFRANRSLPWWAVGLSVMATQLSAITLVGTTGKAYADGMKFVQIYFGLPIAMVILSIFVVPFFYRANVYTAYEYLERRFDLKTRTLAAFTFLIQRGLSCGIVISAPSIILSIVLGWPLPVTIMIIGLPTIAYTMVGGVQAVTWTDVKQMGIILFAMGSAVCVLIFGLPHGMSTSTALHVAGAVGRMQSIDTSFNLRTDYTLWSGMLGGLFLMLSYFGCDQSQVQRYLTAKSVDSARHSPHLRPEHSRASWPPPKETAPWAEFGQPRAPVALGMLRGTLSDEHCDPTHLTKFQSDLDVRSKESVFNCASFGPSTPVPPARQS